MFLVLRYLPGSPPWVSPFCSHGSAIYRLHLYSCYHCLLPTAPLLLWYLTCLVLLPPAAAGSAAMHGSACDAQRLPAVQFVAGRGAGGTTRNTCPTMPLLLIFCMLPACVYCCCTAFCYGSNVRVLAGTGLLPHIYLGWTCVLPAVAALLVSTTCMPRYSIAGLLLVCRCTVVTHVRYSVLYRACLQYAFMPTPATLPLYVLLLLLPVPPWMPRCLPSYWRLPVPAFPLLYHLLRTAIVLPPLVHYYFPYPSAFVGSPALPAWCTHCSTFLQCLS